ncbi:hypothetical protein [Rhizobium mongolense]|uniref:Uncharacterized protein n=1 Tax=Rhizobium mongolense TaxID=57676 RepID=A0A7W6RTR9_9HYPH|nr:hypothetical protein [Rhizobium mongolense]MBB4277770.1 hypothetical protein [Rhizobium mongolense]
MNRSANSVTIDAVLRDDASVRTVPRAQEVEATSPRGLMHQAMAIGQIS